jgi:hypothetical protein
MPEHAAPRCLARAPNAGPAGRRRRLNRNQSGIGILAAGCLAATLALLPGFGRANMDAVRTAMAILMEKTVKLGKPHVRGAYPVGVASAPGLHFDQIRMNNFFGIVDEVANEQGGIVTLFVKTGNEYVRVATNLKKSDGSRAVGIALDPNSPAMAMIRKGEAYYGEAIILGRPYFVGYEPIRDYTRQKNVIGVYFVGSMQ